MEEINVTCDKCGSGMTGLEKDLHYEIVSDTLLSQDNGTRLWLDVNFKFEQTHNERHFDLCEKCKIELLRGLIND